MPGTDGGGGTLDGGRPGELILDRKASNCVLGDEGTTKTIDKKVSLNVCTCATVLQWQEQDVITALRTLETLFKTR